MITNTALNYRMSSRPISIIPQPTRVIPQAGSLAVTRDWSISSPEELTTEAEFLAERLRNSTGFSFSVCRESQASGVGISLAISPAWQHLGKEGYSLHVTAGGVEIRALGARGIFSGIQTLFQLWPPAIYSASPRVHIDWVLPCVLIEDQPRFAWRGAMLDCGRYFMPVAFVKKFIDLLAIHKLNRFHWHLTEDQGWRIEIKKYPRLTEIGAWRKETQRGHYFAEAGGDGIPHGGYYSQEEVREIVAYAARRHIEVIPEIEMPGHSQAAIAAYPELGSSDEAQEVSTHWAIHEHGVCNPNSTVIGFFQDVLDEVMALFPSPYIHIGGDEAVKTLWEENPEIVRQMHAVGAANMEELQSWFIRQIEGFLISRGRKLIGWDEIMEGGLAPQAAIMSWRGIEAGVTAARMGHDVVMTPEEFTYLNFYQNEDISEEPLAIGGFLPLDKVYAYEPVPVHLEPERAVHILGVQGQLWSEYLQNPSEVEYMAFPRLVALAEVGWTQTNNKNYESFIARLYWHLKRLDTLHVRHAGIPLHQSKDPGVDKSEPQEKLAEA